VVAEVNIPDRTGIEQLLQALYAARTGGQLERLCGLFAPDAHFKISGSSDGKAIAIAAKGAAEIRSWLGVMLKTFRITRHDILATVVDGSRASVHWRADIHSRITGITVVTELMDFVEVGDGKIVSYIELFVPV
jgi:ketosteroid isomerase-like protein